MSVAAPAVPADLNGHPHSPVPVYENSPTFRMAVRQLESVAEVIDIDKGILNRMALPKRALVVSVPVKMDNGHTEVLLLATDRLDLEAEHVALGYRFRWAVELFFRWFNCILGCRHLLSTSPNGITIPLSLGIIASLLISLWTGKKPTKRTLEMLPFYFAGLASEEELQEHIDKLHRQES
jgi:IS4 transposase